MSILRCDKHGSWDSDTHEECELCAINRGEAAMLLEQAAKLDNTKDEQCHYCKQWFPYPVSLHHDEKDCSNLTDIAKLATPRTDQLHNIHVAKYVKRIERVERLYDTLLLHARRQEQAIAALEQIITDYQAMTLTLPGWSEYRTKVKWKLAAVREHLEGKS